MKKLFVLLAITSLMVACNNSGESKEAKTDSTTTTVVPAADSTAPAVMVADSSGAMPDSAAKK